MLKPEISPLITGHQRAFAARAAFVLSDTLYVEDERFRDLLDVIDKGELTNRYFQIIVAVHQFRDGDAQVGENTLKRTFDLPQVHSGCLIMWLRLL